MFDGWYLDEAFNTEYDFETSVMPPNNLILYAKWAPPRVWATIHLDLENQDNVIKELVYDEAINTGIMPTVQTT